MENWIDKSESMGNSRGLNRLYPLLGRGSLPLFFRVFSETVQHIRFLQLLELNQAIKPT